MYTYVLYSIYIGGYKMSVKIRVEELLSRKDLSMYWLAKQIGVTYPTILNIVKGNPTSIKLDLLEKICTALECELTDIIEFIKAEKVDE